MDINTFTKSMTKNTETYNYDNGFLVDITDDGKEYSAWIYHKDFGIKSLMFGVSTKAHTKDDFISVVFNNLEDYVEAYEADYMEE